jgi:hypothetical protein
MECCWNNPMKQEWWPAVVIGVMEKKNYRHEPTTGTDDRSRVVHRVGPRDDLFFGWGPRL